MKAAAWELGVREAQNRTFAGIAVAARDRGCSHRKFVLLRFRGNNPYNHPLLQHFSSRRCTAEARPSWPTHDLREWISALDRAGELKRIKAEADPILEIAEITDRVSKWGPRGKHGPGGPALLFENVKGHPGAKVLINQFGSERRMQLALDVDSLDEIADRIQAFMDVKSPQGLLDKIKMLPMLADMGKFFPKEVSSGPCKEVIRRDNFSLLEFPVLQCWPLDGGRFITLPSVITRRSEDRQAQRRHLSHAGLRRAHVPVCTGNARSRAPSTIASRCAGLRPPAKRSPSPLRST